MRVGRAPKGAPKQRKKHRRKQSEEEKQKPEQKERWLSGRKRLIANPLYDLFRTEGSNPSLSVFHPSFAFAPSLAERSEEQKLCIAALRMRRRSFLRSTR